METNKETLQKAIAGMPVYEPGNRIWKEIVQELEFPSLEKDAAKLPQYEPQETVWERIEGELEAGIGTVRKWYGVAAVVIVLGGAGYGLAKLEAGEPPVLYSVEQQDVALRLEAESDADRKFTALLRQCRVSRPQCEKEDFVALKSAFETLRAATDRLRETAGNFNSEPELVRQYRELENEKAQIIEEIAGLI